jgi:hypothetical protein
MSWYAKRFADGRIQLSPNGDARELLEVFEAFASTRPGAAVGQRAEDDGSVTIYLSPITNDFAAMIRATACPKPAHPVDFLCGDRDAWQIWFPDNDAD